MNDVTTKDTAAKKDAPASETSADINKRYVNRKETVAYILYDIGGSVSVGDFERFNTDVLKLKAELFTLMNTIVGIWDIINDTFTGVLVDKTRSRFGKFRPYLIAFAIPAATLGLLKWFCCFFLPTDAAAESSMFKFFFLLIISFISEGIGTFQSISNTGLLATMTPNPEERVWLTARSRQLSAVIDNIPRIVINAVYDLMINDRIGIGYKGFYTSVAACVTVVSVVLSLYFFFSVRERVVQSEKRPKITDGFRTLFRNKPMRVILLSEFLGAFSISIGKNDYYIDVLGISSFGTITEIPGAPISVISYGWVNRMRKRFSNKALWIISSHMDAFMNIIVFLLGIIGGRGSGGWYNSRLKMFFIIFPLEMLRKSMWGIRNVIPNEVTYESIDYCEWRDPDGIRNEGVILTAKGLITKLVGNTTGSLKTWIKSLFGYDYYSKGGVQNERVKFSLFLLSFFVPAVMSLLSVLPKLFYNITPQTREKMYGELLDRREEKVLRHAAVAQTDEGGEEK